MKNVKIHEFPEFTVVEYYKKGMITLFALSNAPVFHYLFASTPPPHDVAVNLTPHPLIFVSGFYNQHKKLTYNFFVSYIKTKGNRMICTAEFSSWLADFKFEFIPEDLISLLKDIAIKYEPLLFS